ncbi:MAG: hypothetical protein AAGG68_26310 [Bacteroidota bacterium]
MRDSNALKDELQRMLSEGKTQYVIQELLNHYQKDKKGFRREIVVLSSRFKRLKAKEIAGLVDYKEADQQINSIKYGLLHIIDHLDQEEITPQEVQISKKPKENKRKKQLIAFVGIAILLVLVSILSWNVLSTKNDERATDFDQEQNKEKEKDASDRSITKRETIEILDTPKSLEDDNDNFARATELRFQQKISADLKDRKDLDFYQFQTSSSYRNEVQINLTSGFEDFSMILNVYNEDKKRIEQVVNRKSNTIEYNFFAAPSSTYFLEVRPYMGQTGKYQLQLSKSVNAEEEISEQEPNNTAKQASMISLNSPKNGHIHKNDVDHYNFSQSTKSSVRVECISLTNSFRPQLTVFSKDGERMVRKTARTNGEALNFLVEMEEAILLIQGYLNTEGDYILKVY